MKSRMHAGVFHFGFQMFPNIYSGFRYPVNVVVDNSGNNDRNILDEITANDVPVAHSLDTTIP